MVKFHLITSNLSSYLMHSGIIYSIEHENCEIFMLIVSSEPYMAIF